MGAHLVRRLVGLVPVLLLVSLAIFFLLSLVPGDPAVTIASAGGEPTRDQVEQVRDQFHLDDPVIVQYLRWVGSLAQLDFGQSFVTGDSVSSHILGRLPVTLSLLGATVLFSLVVGIPLGLLAAIRPGGVVDRVSRGYTSLALAVPHYFLAIVLVVVVAVEWALLPPSGYVAFADSPAGWLRSITLPAAALAFGVSAVVSRQLRSSLIDALASKYVQAAWARGGTYRVVVGKHALKNAASAPLTVLGLYVGYLLGGTVIIEQIFSIPGLGSALLSAISTRDMPTIQGVVVVFVVTQVLLSLTVDLAYGYLNPRVRVR